MYTCFSFKGKNLDICHRLHAFIRSNVLENMASLQHIYQQKTSKTSKIFFFEFPSSHHLYVFCMFVLWCMLVQPCHMKM